MYFYVGRLYFKNVKTEQKKSLSKTSNKQQQKNVIHENPYPPYKSKITFKK